MDEKIEILKLIAKIPSKKCSPIDILPLSLLKSCSSIFAPMISNLTNLSLHEGIFPAALKTAQVTPLLKKADLDQELPSSYRPISNLRTISKIVERVIHSRLSAHFEGCPSFPIYQSG